MAIGAFAEVPTTRKPGGSSVTRSPWLIQTGYFSPLRHTPSNSGGVVGDLDLGAAELAMMAGLDLAAELLRHRLLAVADAEHRHAGLVDRGGGERRVLVEHRGRAAGEDHRLRPHRARRLPRRFLVGHDLAIDALLAHAPRDQLGHLRAEIDDEDLVVVLRRDVGRDGFGGFRGCGGWPHPHPNTRPGPMWATPAAACLWVAAPPLPPSP